MGAREIKNIRDFYGAHVIARGERIDDYMITKISQISQISIQNDEE